MTSLDSIIADRWCTRIQWGTAGKVMHSCMHVCFWWGNGKEIDHLEDKVADGRTILKLNFTKQNGRV